MTPRVSPTIRNGAATIVPAALAVAPTTLSGWESVVVVVVVVSTGGSPGAAVVYVVWLVVSAHDCNVTQPNRITLRPRAEIIVFFMAVAPPRTRIARARDTQ